MPRGYGRRASLLLSFTILAVAGCSGGGEPVRELDVDASYGELAEQLRAMKATLETIPDRYVADGKRERERLLQELDSTVKKLNQQVVEYGRRWNDVSSHRSNLPDFSVEVFLTCNYARELFLAEFRRIEQNNPIAAKKLTGAIRRFERIMSA